MQTKLRIGSSRDPLEAEADALADAVVGGAPRTVSISANTSTEGHAGRGPSGDFESRLAALRGGGQSLPPSEQDFFETRLGHDFSAIRLHTGPRARALADAVNAQAFTYGRDIVLGNHGDVRGGSPDRHLLAHELAHSIQQGSARAKDGATAAPVPLSLAPRALQRRGPGEGRGRGTDESIEVDPQTGVVSESATEARVAREVTRLRPEIPWAINVFSMMVFDSNFYGDSGVFNFRGREMRGGELNNYFIAMAMSHQCYSWAETEDMIWLWNTSQHVFPGDPTITEEMMFAAREGYFDEVERRDCPEPRPMQTPLYACFPGDTPVTMADGTERRIDGLLLGDALMGWDGDAHAMTGGVITALHQHEPAALLTFRLSSGKTFRVTASHPLYCDGEWRRAGTLRAGESLATMGADTLVPVQIVGIDPGGIAGPVYTLSVATCHNYFAGSVLAHNK